MTKNRFPKPQKIDLFLNRFFDVLVVAKRRRRLEFWRRVALDFPDDPERPDDERNRFFWRISAKTYKIFKNIQKSSKAIQKHRKTAPKLQNRIARAGGNPVLTLWGRFLMILDCSWRLLIVVGNFCSQFQPGLEWLLDYIFWARPLAGQDWGGRNTWFAIGFEAFLKGVVKRFWMVV